MRRARSHREADDRGAGRPREHARRSAAVANITLRFHPTTDDYERATGQAWFTSGAVVNNELHLLPLAVLRDRGVLERTIRHELVHVMTDSALGKRPAWVREGAAIYFAGERPIPGEPAGAGRPSRSLARSCPEDNELLRPVSVGALSNAYARARVLRAPDCGRPEMERRQVNGPERGGESPDAPTRRSCRLASRLGTRRGNRSHECLCCCQRRCAELLTRPPVPIGVSIPRMRWNRRKPTGLCWRASWRWRRGRCNRPAAPSPVSGSPSASTSTGSISGYWPAGSEPAVTFYRGRGGGRRRRPAVRRPVATGGISRRLHGRRSLIRRQFPGGPQQRQPSSRSWRGEGAELGFPPTSTWVPSLGKGEKEDPRRRGGLQKGGR